MHAPSRTVVSLALLIGALLVSVAAPCADALVLDAYAWPPSVAPGDTVRIYVSCSEPTYDLEIYRDGATRQTVLTQSALPGGVQSVPDSAYAKGCDWNPSVVVPIPANWKSGVYVAELDVPDTLENAVFVVREANPGSGAPILFQTSLATWAAYNAWGGKSLNDYSSSNGMRSYFASLKRPFIDYQGRGEWPRWELQLASFLERSGFDVAYCTDLDTHFMPQLENHYDVFVICGQDEYWSYEMRNNIEGRIARGQNVAIFGAATGWWQMRLDQPDVITCYKDKTLDPLWGAEDYRVTVNWYDDPVYRPENYMTGVSFRNGGYHNFGGWYPDTLGYGAYTVTDDGHWAFSGTGLSNGETFGGEDTVVGYETDGALFQMTGGFPVTTGLDGSPLNYTILATAPASNGYATMGVFSGPGMVFNAATTDWADGLAEDPSADPVVSQITLNVMQVLLAGTVSAPEPSGPAAAASLRVTVQPNPSYGHAAITWSGAAGADARVAIYDVRGALVARPLAGSRFQAGAVTWDGRDLSGRPAPAGLYFAVVEVRGVHGSARVLLVR